MAVEPSLAPDPSARLDEIIAHEEKVFVERQPRSASTDRPGPGLAGRGGDLELADHLAPGGLAQPRRRFQDLRRRRQRVRRPPRRLRRRPGRPRPSGHRGGRAPAGRPGHPLRPADGNGHRGGRGIGPTIRAPLVAVQQFGDRGDHGRRPSHAGHHRERPAHQGRGLLSRPPRLGPGVGGARGRRVRAGPSTARAFPAAAGSRRPSPT